jgi:hypothetical protein
MVGSNIRTAEYSGVYIKRMLTRFAARDLRGGGLSDAGAVPLGAVGQGEALLLVTVFA